MESLPLAKEDLLDHEYIPVGPLMPLRLLIGASSQRVGRRPDEWTTRSRETLLRYKVVPL